MLPVRLFRALAAAQSFGSEGVGSQGVCGVSSLKLILAVNDQFIARLTSS
jgi:hypothetical protein